MSGISLGVMSAGAYGLRSTTLVVLNVEMIRGLNLPGTPRDTSACCGRSFSSRTMSVPKIDGHCFLCPYMQPSQHSYHPKSTDFGTAKHFGNCHYTALRTNKMKRHKSSAKVTAYFFIKPADVCCQRCSVGACDL